MRKLNEAEALTRAVMTSKWDVMQYPCTQPPPPRAWFRVTEDGVTWRQPLEQHYDFSDGRDAKLLFKDVCHRLIHHFVFDVQVEGNTGDVTLLFNSDHTKQQLWAIPLDTYMGLVGEVAHDQTIWADMNINRTKNPVIRRRSPPPGW